MTQTLILFGFSGFDTSKLQQLNGWAPNLVDAAVVLLDDGVLGSVQPQDGGGTKTLPYDALRAASIPLKVVAEDLEARGFTSEQLLPGIEAVSYGDVIDLIEAATKVVNWL